MTTINLILVVTTVVLATKGDHHFIGFLIISLAGILSQVAYYYSKRDERKKKKAEGKNESCMADILFDCGDITDCAKAGKSLDCKDGDCGGIDCTP